MPTIEQTEKFEKWFRRLTDARAKAKVLVRIERLADGNPGDTSPVGAGVSELRIHFGPGYRVYYVTRGDVFVLLCGGDKSSQDRDIREAKIIATSLGE